MHPVGPRDLSAMPLHVLFPEQYEHSKRMIVRDFAYFGLWVTGLVVLVAWAFG